MSVAWFAARVAASRGPARHCFRRHGAGTDPSSLHIAADSQAEGKGAAPEAIIADMLAHSNGNPDEDVSAGSDGTDASAAASRPSEGAAAPPKQQQPPFVDDTNDGDLTNIDLGPPTESAAAPEPDDPIPLSTPLSGVEPRDGLSNGAVATPQQPRPAEASSSSSPTEDPQEIVLGGVLQSITLTTYEDSAPLASGAAIAGDQALDKEVRASRLAPGVVSPAIRSAVEPVMICDGHRPRCRSRAAAH